MAKAPLDAEREQQLRGDFRRYMELALTPLFDVCKVEQAERERLYEAVVQANMVSVLGHLEDAKRATRQELADQIRMWLPGFEARVINVQESASDITRYEKALTELLDSVSPNQSPKGNKEEA